jgi:hypothetical protein
MNRGILDTETKKKRFKEIINQHEWLKMSTKKIGILSIFFHS